MKDRVISASDSKPKCLAIHDDEDDQGRAVTITKRGRPVAILGPAKKESWKSPIGLWIGKAQIMGDIVNADTSGLWGCCTWIPVRAMLDHRRARRRNWDANFNL